MQANYANSPMSPSRVLMTTFPSNVKNINGETASVMINNHNFTIGQCRYGLSPKQDALLHAVLSPKKINYFNIDTNETQKVVSYRAQIAHGLHVYVTLKASLNDCISGLCVSINKSERKLIEDRRSLPKFVAFFQTPEHPQMPTQQFNQLPPQTTSAVDFLNEPLAELNMKDLVHDSDVLPYKGNLFLLKPQNQAENIHAMLLPESEHRFNQLMRHVADTDVQGMITAHYAMNNSKDKKTFSEFKSAWEKQHKAAQAKLKASQSTQNLSQLPLFVSLGASNRFAYDQILKGSFLSQFLNGDPIYSEHGVKATSVLKDLDHKRICQEPTVIVGIDQSGGSQKEKGKTDQLMQSCLLKEAVSNNHFVKDSHIILALTPKYVKGTIDQMPSKSSSKSSQELQGIVATIGPKHVITPRKVVRTTDGYLLIGDVE